MTLTSKIVCLLLAIWLSAAAVLPLFGMNLIASQAGLVSFDPSEETLYLFVTRSACFATSVFYLTNFLRRRRPLSSVSPLLVLSIMHFVFGVAYILVFSFFNFLHSSRIWNIQHILLESKSIDLELSKTCPIMALWPLENFLSHFEVQFCQKKSTF